MLRFFPIHHPLRTRIKSAGLSGSLGSPRYRINTDCVATRYFSGVITTSHFSCRTNNTEFSVLDASTIIKRTRLLSRPIALNQLQRWSKVYSVPMSTIAMSIPSDDAGFIRPRPDAPFVQFEKLERSQNDTRSYRLLRLDNKLEALVIHDPETDKASAALDVHVGSLADPNEIQGLAHFCEHMLFLGTDKYPQENAYNQYLSEHGGRSNAYTSQEHTNYYFDVDHNALEGALDRFSRFFVAPMFDASCTEREMRAVDSENKKNLQNDGWRFYQLEKSLSHPDHPYSKFSTGNLETLMLDPQKAGINVRDALLRFYDEHYSANRMKLVVLGRESLDQLTDWVVEKFLEVPNKDLPERPPLPHPYDASRLRKQVLARPIKDTRTLEISWPFADQTEYYRVQPSNYISHLVGHEGAGSILSVLKRRGLANYLSAGRSGGARGFDFFKVSIDLTEKGLERYEEVVATVFRYIELLRQVGIQKWVFDEVRNLSDMNFRFKEKSPPASYASELASVMQRPYPRAWVLSGPYLIREYDPELIKYCLSYLRHDNVTIWLRAQKFSSNGMQKERWYGTEYRLEPISRSLAKTLEDIATGKDTVDDGLHLPAPNAFIPSDFDTGKRTVLEPTKRPTLLLDSPSIRLWHKKDDTFWVPKAYAWFMFKSPLAYNTPRNSVLQRLYALMLKDSLNEYTYDAEVAGLAYNLEVQQEGLLLSVEGYNHKLPLLVEKIVQRMRSLEVDEDRFLLLKDQMLRAYKNFEFEAPHQHAIYYASYLIQDAMWLNEEKLDQLQTIQSQDLAAFYPQSLQQTFLESLIYGNISEQSAVDMVRNIENILQSAPMYASQHHHPRSIMLPLTGGRYIYQRMVPNPDNLNSAIEYYCQINDVSDTRSRALLGLLAQIASEPCFDQLRTKEQLGYLVFSGVRKQPGMMGFRIIIQSERDPIYLENRIEAFLIRLESIIRDMTEEEFKRHVEALCSTLLEKFKNMYEEGRRYWGHVSSGYYEFTQVETDVAHLRTFTKAHLLAFYRRHVDPRSRTQRKLSVHMTSQRLADAGRLAAKASDAALVNVPKADLDHVRSCLTPLGVDVSDERLHLALQAGNIEATLRRLLIDESMATDEEEIDILMLRLEELLAANGSLNVWMRTRRETAIIQGDGNHIPPDNQIIRDIQQWKSSMQLSAAPRPLIELSSKL